MSTQPEGPLRVHYQVEVHGEEKTQALPFVIGVLADLAGTRPPLGDRVFQNLDPASVAALTVGADPGTRERLKTLVERAAPDDGVKVRVLDVGAEELTSMFQEYAGDAWDQSPLFKLVYEETYGQYGGEPYSLILVDDDLGGGAGGDLILGGVTRVATATAAPVLHSADAAHADGMFAWAGEVGRVARESGWAGGIEKPEWTDASGLDFEGTRRLLCAGPFVRHLKCIVRDKIGSFKDIESMSDWLNRWLQQYVASEPGAVSLQKPLAAGEVRLAPSTLSPRILDAAIEVQPGHLVGREEPAVVHDTRLPGL